MKLIYVGRCDGAIMKFLIAIGNIYCKTLQWSKSCNLSSRRQLSSPQNVFRRQLITNLIDLANVINRPNQHPIFKQML